MQKIAEANNVYTAKRNQLDYNLEESKETLKKLNTVTKETERDNITIQENKISSKKQELLGIDDLEKAEIKAIDEKITAEIEKEEIRVGKAADYLKNNEVKDIEPLQKQADEVADMQSYLREWDRW